MLNLYHIKRLSPRDRQKLLATRGLSTRDRKILAALVVEADAHEARPADSRAATLASSSKAWDAAHPPRHVGGQGRPDIPGYISASGPYFYFYGRPCRLPNKGEIWDELPKIHKQFEGAAIRLSNRDGMPTFEVIGTCDKAKLRRVVPRDPFKHPWVHIVIGDFRVPTANDAPWRGSIEVECTRALWTWAAPNWSFDALTHDDAAPDDLKRLTHDDACDHW